MNQILGVVQRDLLGQHDRGALGRAVTRRAVVRHKPLHRRGVDDPAPRPLVDFLLALEHLFQRILATQEHALCVDRERLVEVLLAGLVAAQGPHVRRLDRHARVVHHDVHSLVPLHARPDRELHVPRLGHVRLVVCGFTAVLADELVRAGLAGHAVVEVVGPQGRRVDRVARRRVQVDAEDRRSFGGKGEADGLAESR